MPNGKPKKDEEIYKVAERESIERPWASNDKLVFDERSAHGNRTAVIAEDALQESVNFTKQIHQQYLKKEQDAAENNRYTLNYLYGLYPEEWIALREMIKQWKADSS
jgi:hypothetical protein